MCVRGKQHSPEQNPLQSAEIRGRTENCSHREERQDTFSFGQQIYLRLFTDGKISLGVVPSRPLIWSEFTVYSHVRCLTVHDFKSSARRTRCFAGDSPFLCCLCFRQLLSTCTPRILPDNGRGQTGRLLRIHGSKVIVLSVTCSSHLFSDGVFSLFPLVIPFLVVRGKLPRTQSLVVKTSGETYFSRALQIQH
jgi:hypothetical protein